MSVVPLYFVKHLIIQQNSNRTVIIIVKQRLLQIFHLYVLAIVIVYIYLPS